MNPACRGDDTFPDNYSSLSLDYKALSWRSGVVGLYLDDFALKYTTVEHAILLTVPRVHPHL